jgi:SRSO17 transposase
VYDWLMHGTDRPELQVMVRRNITSGELAFYLCHTPAPAPLAELVRVAGARWAIEECFQFTKTNVGLDQYQVRRYDAWYRHMSLVMLAAAWLVITAIAVQKGHQHLWTTTDAEQAEYVS